MTDWGMVYVKPNDNGGDSRFDSQIIIQTEDDPIVAQAASALAAKHAKIVSWYNWMPMVITA